MRQHAPLGMFLKFFDGMGDWIPIKFSHSSHQILLVPINNPSKSFCSHQVPKKCPSNSSCSPSTTHQHPCIFIKFLLFPSTIHRNPTVQIKFSKNSFVPIKILLFPWLWKIGRRAQVSTKVNGETREKLRQSAKRSAAVRGQAQWKADVCRVRIFRVRIFGLPGVVEDRGQICFSRGSSALFPSWARPERERENCGAR